MSGEDSSEDEKTLAQTFVLSQLANIPAIGDNTDAETTGSSSDDEEPNIVFSKINWEETTDGMQQSPRAQGNISSPAGAVVSPHPVPVVPSLQLRSATGAAASTSHNITTVADPEEVELDMSSPAASDDKQEAEEARPGNSSSAPSPAASPDAATGSGWLLGAAGRLADLATPRTRASQVDGPHPVLRGSAGGTAPSADAVAAEEAALAQRFHEIVASGVEADIVPGCSNLVLEDSVAGVGGGELDALIARLQAGVVLDLDATRPADLPDPSTLFTDSDDEAPAPAPPPKPAAPPPAPKPRPAMPAAPVTTTPAAAVPKPAAAAAPPMPAPPGMMPARFKMFGPGPVAPAAAGPPEGDASLAPDGEPARATVVQDLRASIAESLTKIEQARADSAKAAAAAKSDDSDSDDGELLAVRQQLKAGVRPSPVRPSPAKSGAPAAGGAALAAAPSKAAAAKPSAPAPKPAGSGPTSHSIAVGGDEVMGDPGIATGARKSMFVSTSDMPGGGGGPGTTAPATRSLFVGSHSLDSDDASDEDDIVIGLPRLPVGTGHATAVEKGLEGGGHATAVTRGQTASVGTTPSAATASRSSTAKASAGAGPPPKAHATATGGTSTPAVPQLAHMNFDTDELGPLYGAPAAAPGSNAEKGAKRVGAGTRIKLPPGPQVEVPRPAAVSCGTQSDAPTSPMAAPAPAPRSSTSTVAAPAASAAASASAATVDPAAAAAAAMPGPATKQVATASGSTAMPVPAQPAATSTSVTAPSPQPKPTAASEQAVAHAGQRAASAAPAVPAALSFPRLPPWMPASSCFTVMFASPDGMPTHAVAAAVEWLLSQAAGNAPPRPPHTHSPAGTVHAAFTTVGLMLVSLPPGHPMLRGVPALASKQSGSSALTRVLVAACTPGEVDTDRARAADYNCDEDAVDDAVRAMRTALSQLTWATLLSAQAAQSSSSSSAPSSPSPASVAAAAAAAATAAAQGAKDSLFLWTSCVEGIDLITGVPTSYALAPAGGSSADGQAAAFTTIAGGSMFVTSPSGASATAAPAGTPAAPGAAAAHASRAAAPVLAPGAEVVVSTLARGGTSSPRTLSTVLMRAAGVGLSLAGMQTFYATEDTASYVATRTPHRPMPYMGCVAMAFFGRGEAAARWQAQLGPPDQDVARKAEPHSLHAVLRGSDHRLLACSTDAHGASRELAMLLSAPTDAAATAATTATAAVPPAAAGPAASPVAQVVASVEPTAQWLALHAGTGRELVAALWVVHHLAWCGFSVRTLLRTQLSQEQLGSVQATRTVPEALFAAVKEGTPMLVVELVKEECAAQLPLALANVHALREVPVPGEASDPRVSSSGARFSSSGGAAPITSPRGAAGARSSTAAAAQAVLCGMTAAESEVLRMLVGGQAGVSTQPSAAAAQQLLDLAAKELGTEAGIPSSDLDDSESGAQRSTDELLLVALQGKSLPDVLLLALELLRHPHVGTAAPVLVEAPGGSAQLVLPHSVEVAGVRLLRHAPPDASRYLKSCVDVSAALPVHQAGASGSTGAGAAAAGPHGTPAIAGRPAALLPGAPTLLMALHGPDVRAQVAAAVSSWRALVRPRPGNSSIGLVDDDSAGATRTVKEAGLSEAAASLLRALGPWSAQQYAAVGAYHPPLLVATSASVTDSRQLLAQCFQAASQLALDPGFHNGVVRPVQPPQLNAAVHLLTTPHPFSTVLAVCVGTGGPSSTPPAAKPAVQQLPRCLKLLWREGFTVRAASTVRLSEASAASLCAPQLAGQHTVLVWLWRSNAVQHLHTLMAESGLGSASVVAAPSYAAAQGVLNTVWPDVALPEQQARTSAPAAVGAQGVEGRATGATAAKARQLVRGSSAGLMQATCMLLLPNKATNSGAAAASTVSTLDWAAAAEALDAVRGEGFVVTGLQAVRLSHAQVGEVSKLFKLSPQQAAALTAATADAAGTCASLNTAVMPACTPTAAVGAHVLVVALARDNAVSHLQLRAQEASCAASRGLAQLGGAALRGASLAAVAGSVAVSGSSSAAEQQLVYFFDGLNADGVPQLKIVANK